MSTPPDDLPESYKACRAADEAFWEEQERNIQGALGQPCCTLSGIASGLMQMPGRFAVIVHGEDECASCFRHVGPAAVQFYCTGLTEHEFVTGRMAEPLRRCLRLVAEHTAPDAIFVLGACPVEVVGDRFETVVAEVQKEFPDIPMQALHTSGLKVGSQTAMLDWMFDALASLPAAVPHDRRWKRRARDAAFRVVTRSFETWTDELPAAVHDVRALPAPSVPPPEQCVNFVGLPRLRRTELAPEPARVLEAAGLLLVGNYPHEATFDDWRVVKYARHGFVADRSLYPKLIRRLEGAGQVVHEVPLPVGLQQTRAVYEAIGEATGTSAALADAIAEPLAAAQEAVDRFKARFGGLRMAYGLRMNNNYGADELAYQGLGDFFAMLELGLDVTLLVQGPPDKRDRFEKMFARRNISLPFELFTEPWILADLLAAGGYDVAYLADHCRNEASKAGVAMIPIRTLEPWLGGVVRNLDRMEHMLRDVGR